MPLRPHGLVEVADEAGDVEDVKTGHDTILSMQTKSVKGRGEHSGEKALSSQATSLGTARSIAGWVGL